MTNNRGERRPAVALAAFSRADGECVPLSVRICESSGSTYALDFDVPTEDAERFCRGLGEAIAAAKRNAQARRAQATRPFGPDIGGYGGES